METTMPTTGRASVVEMAPAKVANRLLYIDNIRIFLTSLVIAHHLMIYYAGSGGWIVHEGRQDDITSAFGGWFCAVNQAYFMGLFLFISAYFVPGAFDRKGPRKFLIDRLIRLGIPLVFYSWILRPVLIYLGSGPSSSLGTWYTQNYYREYGIIGGGPLWFIETLLIFSVLYVIGRLLVRPQYSLVERPERFPAHTTIVLFAFFVGVISFLVRLVSPVNDTFAPLNLQFANFVQYIALFIAGLMAYRHNWLNSLTVKIGKGWLTVAIVLVLIYPPMALLSGGAENVEPFLGGWHWQAMLLAQWESFLCVSASIGLVYLFQRHLDRQGPLARELSRSAYTAYLIHEPVISFLALLAASVMIYPLVKFALAVVFFIPLCFGLSALIRRLPYAERIL